jgi:hypothetical protein
MVYIKQSYTKLDGEHPTKTEGSTRSVDLRPQALRALKEQQAPSRLKSEFVFCNGVGGTPGRLRLRQGGGGVRAIDRVMQR